MTRKIEYSVITRQMLIMLKQDIKWPKKLMYQLAGLQARKEIGRVNEDK